MRFHVTQPQDKREEGRRAADIVEMSAEWLRNLARNYADGVPGMAPQEHPAWDIAAEIERLTEAELLRATEMVKLEQRIGHQEDEIKRLRELKTPASRKLVNITKALLDDANAEVEQLMEANTRMAKGCEEMGDEIGCLRTALRDMIEISTRNSEATLLLIAIRRCAEHVLDKDLPTAEHVRGIMK
jgi:hypothetical protein